MATLTIKNMPNELYDRLKQRAAGHRRSINGEAIVLLEQSLGAGRTDIEAALQARIDARRERLAREGLPPLTDDFLTEANNWGRP